MTYDRMPLMRVTVRSHDMHDQALKKKSIITAARSNLFKFATDKKEDRRTINIRSQPRNFNYKNRSRRADGKHRMKNPPLRATPPLLPRSVLKYNTGNGVYARALRAGEFAALYPRVRSSARLPAERGEFIVICLPGIGYSAKILELQTGSRVFECRSSKPWYIPPLPAACVRPSPI